MNPLKRTVSVSLAFLALAAVNACSAGTGRATQPASPRATADAPPPVRAATVSVRARKAPLGIADITPMSEKAETIGVGSPIIVTFDRTVTNRAATEAVLQVRAERPVDGA